MSHPEHYELEQQEKYWWSVYAQSVLHGRRINVFAKQQWAKVKAKLEKAATHEDKK